MPLAGLARAFDVKHLGRAPARFEESQLDVWQRQVAHHMSVEESDQWLSAAVPAGLDPQARRMTHVFDAEQDWIFTNADGEEIDEQEETGDDDEEIEAKPEQDPYFARYNGGRRIKELPEIAKFL